MQLPITQRYTSTDRVEVYLPDRHEVAVTDLLISWRLVIVREGAKVTVRPEAIGIQGRVITKEGYDVPVNELSISPMAGAYDDDGISFEIHRIDIHQNRAIIAL